MMLTKQSLKEIEQQLEQMIRDFLDSENSHEKLPPEIVVFAKTQLAWTDAQIVAERRRVREVMTHQASVCCPKETAKLQSDLEAAQQALQTVGPQLQQQIADLERKLHDLRQTPVKLAAQLEESEAAKSKLERCLPVWANRERQDIHKDHDQLHRERNELKAGIDQLRLVVANPTDVDLLRLYESSESRLLVDDANSVSDLGRLLKVDANSSYQSYVITPETNQHIAKIREALPTLEKQLEELDAEVEENIDSKIRSIRCMYHKG